MHTFPVTLHHAYYHGGFFNVRVEYDRLLPPDERAVTILLGSSGRELDGRIDRHANSNATARVRVGAELRDWFHVHFKLGDVMIVAPIGDTIRLSDGK
jgi:hypothetical protein